MVCVGMASGPGIARRFDIQQPHDDRFQRYSLVGWRRVLEASVFRLNGFHRFIERFADVGSFRQIQ